jgi:hypothetical protein
MDCRAYFISFATNPPVAQIPEVVPSQQFGAAAALTPDPLVPSRFRLFNFIMLNFSSIVPKPSFFGQGKEKCIKIWLAVWNSFIERYFENIQKLKHILTLNSHDSYLLGGFLVILFFIIDQNMTGKVYVTNWPTKIANTGCLATSPDIAFVLVGMLLVLLFIF